MQGFYGLRNLCIFFVKDHCKPFTVLGQTVASVLPGVEGGGLPEKKDGGARQKF